MFAVPALAVLIGLGLWQLDRLAWKLDLIAAREAAHAAPSLALNAETMDFAKIRIRGKFRHDQEVHLVAPPRSGRRGYHILTPLAPEGVTWSVLIDRGWVPVDRKEGALRPEGLVDGLVEISGIARRPAGPGWFTPNNEPERNIWYWRDLESIADQQGVSLLPLFIEADAAPNPGGYPVGGQTRFILTNNHLGYAITWFGLAAGLVVVYIAFHWRRREIKG